MADSVQNLVILNEVLNDAFDVAFSDALSSKDNWAAKLTEDSPTRQRAVEYPFLYNNVGLSIYEEGETPAYNTLIGEHVRIALKKVAGGVQIKQLDFEDPFFQSMLLKRATGLGIQAAYHRLDRIVNALNLGDTDSYYTMYDGQQLFSNTHTIGGVTFDNLISGTLDDTNFTIAKSLLKRVPWGPGGQYLPMNGAEFYLFVPPELEYKAKSLMQNTLLPIANYNTENIYKGEATVIVEERLTDANDWFLIASLPQAKPFVTPRHDTLGGYNLVPETDPKDHSVLYQDEYRWTLKFFEETFPTNFWQMVKVVNA